MPGWAVIVGSMSSTEGLAEAIAQGMEAKAAVRALLEMFVSKGVLDNGDIGVIDGRRGDLRGAQGEDQLVLIGVVDLVDPPGQNARLRVGVKEAQYLVVGPTLGFGDTKWPAFRKAFVQGVCAYGPLEASEVLAMRRTSSPRA